MLARKSCDRARLRQRKRQGRPEAVRRASDLKERRARANAIDATVSVLRGAFGNLTAVKWQ